MLVGFAMSKNGYWLHLDKHLTTDVLVLYVYGQFDAFPATSQIVIFVAFTIVLFIASHDEIQYEVFL